MHRNFDYAVQGAENSGATCEEDRREFPKSCGRFVVWTQPRVTVLLSTSLTSNAIAKSGAGGGRIRDRRQTAPRQDGAKQGKPRDGHKLL
ncbi:hypothetical protein M1D34_25310 [Ensifer sp. D2-11]